MRTPGPSLPGLPTWTRDAMTSVMLLTLSTKFMRVPVASTVKVAIPVAVVSTAGTTSLPVRSAVYVLPGGAVTPVEADVPVVEVTATALDVVVALVDVGATVVVVLFVVRAVVGGLVVVVAPWLAHPKMSSTTARRGRHRHNLFTTAPPDEEASQGSSRARRKRALVAHWYSLSGLTSPASEEEDARGGPSLDAGK